jgi:glycerol-3-phosphate acyltransferase PlsX
MKVVVDLLGSENTPERLYRAVDALSLPKGAELILIGPPSLPVQIPCTEFIRMDEDPLIALRKKKEASLYLGLRLLKEKKADAFISAGNTGALVSASKMVLSMLPGLLRPALLAHIPTKKEPVAVLDVGANVPSKTAHLVQFAQMGVAYKKALGCPNPRVGLLNIGQEALKGTHDHRQAYRELQSLPIHFVGNVEGREVFDGDVDLLVTDGFTGNVFLKTAEGIASLILDRLAEHKEVFRDKLSDLQRHLHYANYPGALLIGVRGIVIKCHSYSTPEAFAGAVLGALQLASSSILSRLSRATCL